MKIYAVFVKTSGNSYRYIDSQWAVRGNTTEVKSGTACGRAHELNETFKAFACSFEASIVELSLMDVALVEAPKAERQNEAAMQSRDDQKEDEPRTQAHQKNAG